MQAHENQSSSATEITSAEAIKRCRPHEQSSGPEVKGITWIQRICDICGDSRSTRRHRKCSRIRQKRYRRAGE